MGNTKHTHQYQRVQKARRKDAVIWYTCIAVGCHHRERIEFMENRVSICHRCGDEFILTKKVLYESKLVKPHCESCTRGNKQKAVNKLAEIFMTDDV